MKCTFIAVVFASCIYFAYPMYRIVFKGKRELVVNILLPGVDHETITGFCVTFCYLASIASLGIIGITAFDMLMQFMICGYISFNVMLEDSIKSLNSMLLKNKHSIKYHRLYLRNILIAFQDVERYG